MVFFNERHQGPDVQAHINCLYCQKNQDWPWLMSPADVNDNLLISRYWENAEKSSKSVWSRWTIVQNQSPSTYHATAQAAIVQSKTRKPELRAEWLMLSTFPEDPAAKPLVQTSAFRSCSARQCAAANERWFLSLRWNVEGTISTWKVPRILLFVWRDCLVASPKMCWERARCCPTGPCMHETAIMASQKNWIN